VPDCDTTACCSRGDAGRFHDPILDSRYWISIRLSVREGANEPRVTVPSTTTSSSRRRRHLDRQSGGDRPYGNDLDPTLNLDILEVSSGTSALEGHRDAVALETVHRIIGFQRRLVESGAFTNPRSHIYYLPELYAPISAAATPPSLRCRWRRGRHRPEILRVHPRPVLVYVQRELIAHEMNAFDAALA